MEELAMFLVNDEEDETDSEEEFDDFEKLKREMFLTVMQGSLNAVFDREPRNRIRGFAEKFLIEYREDEFCRFFRMSKTSAMKFIEEVERIVEIHEYTHLRPPTGFVGEVPLRVKVLMMLWYVASSCTYRELSNIFGVTESLAFNSVRDLIDLTVDHLLEKFVSWPKEEECAEISGMFRDINNFPDVIGFIDGTHIPIKRPQERPQDYYNRKDFYSVQLQAVVRKDLRFIDVYTGWPGKVHDARVFGSSPLAERGGHLWGRRHILGDSAYPCLYWLLTPYKQPRDGALTDEQTRHNRILSSMRVTVERAFGLLKARFKRLRLLFQLSVEQMNKTIITACVLHNFCIISADELTFEDEQGNQAAVPIGNAPIVNNLFRDQDRQRGRWRDYKSQGIFRILTNL